MRFGRTVTAGIALAAFALLACAASRAPEGAPAGGGGLAIGIAVGDHWLRVGDDTTAARPGDGPQVAVWLEDSAGAFVSTVFITRRAAVEDWAGVAGAGDGGTVTPRPLPVWAGKHSGIGVEPMASCGACHGKRRSDDKTIAGDPILEALTTPSPIAGLSCEWAVPDRIEPGTYGVRVEINHWVDPNETYGAADDQDDAPRGSGQPSLVWGGVVEIGGEPDESELVLLGHGHPAGANGEVDPDLTGLTTALTIADTIRVAFAPID